MSNLDTMVEMDPSGAASWEHFRLVSYDNRGSGMSDRSAVDFSLEAMIRDLRAVVNRVAEGPVTLWAMFDGVPIVIAYAARYPSEVSALAVADGWTRFSDQDQRPARAVERALRNQDWVLYTETLARVLLGETFDRGLVERMGAYFRGCVEPDTLRAAYADMETWDVLDLLPLVQAPTLVLYNRHNQFLAPESSQRIAAGIPNAEFRTFDDVTYYSVPGIIAEWLGGDAGTQPVVSDARVQPSAFRTVLFTDLVGHTEMMSRLGDQRGRDVLREHERITREVLKANGGTEVKTMGDGFMASFGSVTKAVECAIALQRAFAERGSVGAPLGDGGGAGGAAPNDAAMQNQPVEPLSVRCGLNAGEPIEEDGDLFGATVILASRIAAKAEGGEILVANAVRELCAGKGFAFSDRGEFVAKGFEEPVRVYEVRWRE
jgi:class 3 adenylate cyclase/pimeloyl-ACP methyl ester carboxylesterase